MSTTDTTRTADVSAIMAGASDLARYYTAHCWEETSLRVIGCGSDAYTLAEHLADCGIATSADLDASYAGDAANGICVPCLAQTTLADDYTPLSGTVTYDCVEHA